MYIHAYEKSLLEPLAAAPRLLAAKLPDLPGAQRCASSMPELGQHQKYNQTHDLHGALKFSTHAPVTRRTQPRHCNLCSQIFRSRHDRCFSRLRTHYLANQGCISNKGAAGQGTSRHSHLWVRASFLALASAIPGNHSTIAEVVQQMLGWLVALFQFALVRAFSWGFALVLRVFLLVLFWHFLPKTTFRQNQALQGLRSLRHSLPPSHCTPCARPGKQSPQVGMEGIKVEAWRRA